MRKETKEILAYAFAFAASKGQVCIVVGYLIGDRLVEGESPGIELFRVVPQARRSAQRTWSHFLIDKEQVLSSSSSLT